MMGDDRFGYKQSLSTLAASLLLHHHIIYGHRRRSSIQLMLHLKSDTRRRATSFSRFISGCRILISFTYAGEDYLRHAEGACAMTSRLMIRPAYYARYASKRAAIAFCAADWPMLSAMPPIAVSDVQARRPRC